MTSADDHLLRRAGIVFLAGFLVHNGDHVRRSLDAITDHVVWGGTTVAVVAAVTLTLVFTRHPLAPFAAAGAGVAIAFGVSATHLLPDWGALSDPLPGGDIDAFTWLAVLAEVAGAVVLAVAGFIVLRRHGYSYDRLAMADPPTAVASQPG
jgi:hypothetical protein